MKKQSKAYLFAGISILFWSTVATAFKFALQYQSPFELLIGANLTTSIILFGNLVFQKKLYLLRRTSRKQLLSSMLIGVLNPFSYYLMIFKAYDILPAQVAQPINLIWPIILVLISIPLLHQKIELKSIGALLICFSGVVMISSQGGGKGFDISQLPGIYLALGGSVVWSFYWILNMKDTRDDSVKLFLGFLSAGILLLITALFTGQGFPKGGSAWFWAAYTGFFEMGFSFIFWMKALQYSKTTDKVSSLVYIIPFLSLICINFFLGEKIYSTTVFGMMLILSGIFVQKVKRKIKRKI